MSHSEDARVGGIPELEFEPRFCQGCTKPYCFGPCLRTRNSWMETENEIEEAEQ